MPETPNNNYRLQTPEWPLPKETGVRVGVAPIPFHCIDQIELHDDLSIFESGFVPAEQMTDWIANNVVLSVPQDQTNTSYWTNFYHGRVLPLAYGDYSFGGMAGSVIFQKGGFLSGILYHDLQRATEFPYWYTKGLETLENDEKDNDLSTNLINNGFRAAYRFGRVMLNHEQTRQYLIEQWRNEKLAIDIIDSAFSIIDEKQLRLVIPLRVGGTLSRIDHEPTVDGFTSANTHKLRAKEISLGAAVLAHELEAGGALYGTLAVTGLVDIKKAINALDCLAYNPTNFGIVDLHIYRDILACMFGQNLRSLQMTQWGSGPSVYPNNDLGLPKDTDHTALHYDFNFSWHSSKRSHYPADLITSQYLNNAVDDMHHMLLYATYHPNFLQYRESEKYIGKGSIRDAIFIAAQQIGFQPY